MVSFVGLVSAGGGSVFPIIVGLPVCRVVIAAADNVPIMHEE
jgi:hypothetical protein